MPVADAGMVFADAAAPKPDAAMPAMDATVPDAGFDYGKQLLTTAQRLVAVAQDESEILSAATTRS